MQSDKILRKIVIDNASFRNIFAFMQTIPEGSTQPSNFIQPSGSFFCHDNENTPNYPAQ